MRILSTLSLFLFFAAFAPVVVFGQQWGSVEGHVTEAGTGLPLPGATIVVDGTDFGTASNENGYYTFRLPTGRYALRFSIIGFEPLVDSVSVQRDLTTRMDVRMRAALVTLEGITVESYAIQQEAGVHAVTPEDIQHIPSPFKGYQALQSLPGVSSNNELSNQYSVRGGGFNENLIFINGFEVYMPFRPRQGEQEGLGLLNVELADRISLFTGGFPARYGGKLSSALEVLYRRPDGETLSGSASTSLLDAGIAAGASALRGRIGWTIGLRKARARHFFSTQELKGNYQPDYADLQGTFAYRFAEGHEIEALGIWAEHEFLLDPNNQRTYFGTVSTDPRFPSNLQSIWIDYSGSEQDGYTTRFSGLRLRNQLSRKLRSEHDVSYFQTVENEQYEIRGSAVIFQVDPAGGNPDSGDGHFPTGTVQQEDVADNRVRVDTWTGTSRWILSLNRQAVEAGAYLRRLHFDDRLQELAAVVGRTLEGDLARIVVDSLNDGASLNTAQAGFYIQDALELLPASDRLTVTAGLRTDYYSFNDEWTVSPRLSIRFVADERLTLLGAWGLYYQTPTYRELRGAPGTGESILGALNHELKSQRSIQYVAGVEYFFPKSRLYARAEAYYKHLAHLISYAIENVRILYSGENDTRGHTYGLDVQLRGEFVPGLESWANYSFMHAGESFLPPFQNEYNRGSIPRPTDQRHTLSLFIQDYVPSDPTWKIHLRGLFGSGLPYTPPVPGPRIGNIISQVPGPRYSARYPEYMRVDIGVTKRIIISENGIANPLQLELSAELLNVFNMTNTIAYSWVPNREGIWQRIPTRLTPRTFNVRIRVDF